MLYGRFIFLRLDIHRNNTLVHHTLIHSFVHGMLPTHDSNKASSTLASESSVLKVGLALRLFV
jgi:hypothetical protein